MTDKEISLLETMRKQLRRLRLVDINLQIESSKLSNTGIPPIAREMKNIIEDLEKEIEEIEKD